MFAPPQCTNPTIPLASFGSAKYWRRRAEWEARRRNNRHRRMLKDTVRVALKIEGVRIGTYYFPKAQWRALMKAEMERKKFPL